MMFQINWIFSLVCKKCGRVGMCMCSLEDGLDDDDEDDALASL
jgi:hypothetical protein